jgi:hypothetical protein
MLHVPETSVPRARFPLLDIHSHLTWGDPAGETCKLLMPVEEILGVMDRKNIRTMVNLTGGYGADFSLVTASSERAAPLQLAAELCRPRARVAVVGAMPMELDRRTFYEKELELRMSMSYGPGRYDRAYEEHGYDYPLVCALTENRNPTLSRCAWVTRSRSTCASCPSRKRSAYEDLAKESSALALVFRYDGVPRAQRRARARGGARGASAAARRRQLREGHPVAVDAARARAKGGIATARPGAPHRRTPRLCEVHDRLRRAAGDADVDLFGHAAREPRALAARAARRQGGLAEKPARSRPSSRRAGGRFAETRLRPRLQRRFAAHGARDLERRAPARHPVQRCGRPDAGRHRHTDPAVGGGRDRRSLSLRGSVASWCGGRGGSPRSSDATPRSRLIHARRLPGWLERDDPSLARATALPKR